MEFRVLLQTLVIGAAGAFVAWWLYVPAPFLLGPAVLVSIAALAGMRVDIPAHVRNVGFVLVGMGLGSGVTPDVVQAAARWPLSLIMLCLAVAVILWGGGRVLALLFRLDRHTAVLASAPGHLSYVLSLGLDTKADLPLLTVIQSLRVLSLTILTPPLVLLISGETLPRGLPPMEAMNPALILPLAFASVLFGLAFVALKVPAGLLIGAMAASSISHGAGWTPGALPAWLSVPGFVMMGAMLGTRLSGLTPRLLWRASGAAMVLTGLAVLVTSVFAYAASVLLGFPVAMTLMAFAPGGVETMAAMALLMNGDPAYVALHHVVRLFALTALIPLALRQPRSVACARRTKRL